MTPSAPEQVEKRSVHFGSCRKGIVTALATLAAFLGFAVVVVLMIEIFRVPSTGGGPDRALHGLEELLVALALGIPLGGSSGGILAYLVLRFCWQPSRGYRRQAAARSAERAAEQGPS
jgi:hypothetical protein